MKLKYCLFIILLKKHLVFGIQNWNCNCCSYNIHYLSSLHLSLVLPLTFLRIQTRDLYPPSLVSGVKKSSMWPGDLRSEILYFQIPQCSKGHQSCAAGHQGTALAPPAKWGKYFYYFLYITEYICIFFINNKKRQKQHSVYHRCRLQVIWSHLNLNQTKVNLHVLEFMHFRHLFQFRKKYHSNVKFTLSHTKVTFP